MVDGGNDRVSFVDNSITTLTTAVRDWGVPREDWPFFCALKLLACVAIVKVMGLGCEKVIFRKYLHHTFTARKSFRIFLIFVPKNIFTMFFKDLFRIHRIFILLETSETRCVIWGPKLKIKGIEWKKSRSTPTRHSGLFRRWKWST